MHLTSAVWLLQSPFAVAAIAKHGSHVKVPLSWTGPGPIGTMHARDHPLIGAAGAWDFYIFLKDCKDQPQGSCFVVAIAPHRDFLMTVTTAVGLG